uniref:Uncharacterized protein n=1 Tax=Ditylenchus dipsaci TaxID=166011 RepID=A0A915D8U3_9BILA
MKYMFNKTFGAEDDKEVPAESLFVNSAPEESWDRCLASQSLLQSQRPQSSPPLQETESYLTAANFNSYTGDVFEFWSMNKEK